MPQIPGIPQRPVYTSVKAYLLDLAKDIAELVVDPVKKKRFREQLRIYKKMWKVWKTADEADRKGHWKPSMGRPEHPLFYLKRTFNVYNYDHKKEAKRLPGCYSLLAFIHDSQLPHLHKINNKIIVSTEIIEETLASAENQLEGRIIVPGRSSGPNVDEIYLIEEYFNYVKVDLKEHCGEGVSKLKAEELIKQIKKARSLSNAELFESIAKMFKKRELRVMEKNETWLDLDRLLKPWFELGIQRLQQTDKSHEIGLMQYEYQNLLHFARGINIRNFRGFPDSSIAASARMHVSELAKKFQDIAKSTKEFMTAKNPAETEQEATPRTTKRKVEAIRDQVFICYSHKDKQWLDDLLKYLKPLVRNRSVTVWSDEKISPGAEWFEEIKKALASTKVAVLLVTKDFFASEFIHEHELTPLLKEAENGKLRIIWIPVRACLYKETPLRSYQAVIDTEKPMANMKKADRDKAWVKICEEIKKAVSL